MPNLIIETQRCRVEDEDDVGLLWALDRELAYKVQGAQFTRAYKGYLDPFSGKFVAWDGKNRLFNSEDLSFPFGLTQRVIDFYNKMDRPITVIDKRESKSKGSPIDLSSSLKEIDKIPRPYQLAAVQAAREYDHGIIRMPTGAGKSLTAALIVGDIGKKSIIYVVGKDLLYQFHAFFQKVFPGIDIGIIGDGLCKFGDINIVSIWTVGQALGLNKNSILAETEEDEEKDIAPEKYNEIKQLLKDTKVHVIDECQASACETIQTIVSNINAEHLYGMSASPWRDDGADLLIECAVGHKIVDVSASDLIEKGWLVKPYIKFIRVPKYPGKLKKQYQTVYKKYIVENSVRNELVVQATEKMIERGYKPLVLFSSIQHGQILQGLLSQKFSCALLSGKDKIKTRDKAKEDIEKGNIQLIIASRIFDVGLDLPVLSGLVVAGGGKSSVRALQRIGRVIRPYANKKQAAVADFVDDAVYLKKHSQSRKEIYCLEKGFEVKWPKL